jgi:L-histidine Nalpha-methyltransferase
VTSEEQAAFLNDVLVGLSLPQKSVPPRWFYDAAGSDLFEAITRTPEYYLTTAETQLLRDIAPRIADHVTACTTMVEYGSGSSAKTPLLLGALFPETYIAVDVSQSALDGAAQMLRPLYPDMKIQLHCADFTRDKIPLSGECEGAIAGFFPGSTLGNFDNIAAQHVLQHFRDMQGAGSWLVLGTDQCADAVRLEAAYNDAAGVTAQFNLNLLHRINRELSGTIEARSFHHRAFFNPEKHRIEMHLVAQNNLDFSLSGQQFSMRRGETIHTENSHKWPADQMDNMLINAGWTIVQRWQDMETGFAIYLARTA